MSEEAASRPSRRSLLTAAGAALSGSAVARAAGAKTESTPPDILRLPDRVAVYAEGGEIALTRSGAAWRGTGVEVTTEVQDGGTKLAVGLAAPGAKPVRVLLRWRRTFPLSWRYLGDHWERSYGDLEWRGLAGERQMPWYFLASSGKLTHAYGVETGASAFCWWQVDAGGISLWLDVRNGGSGVELGSRQLKAATVIARAGQPGESALDAARAFCRRMCPRPRLASAPVYGSNNWYYTYGQNFGAAEILRDSSIVAELSAGASTRPFMVIDDGWQRQRHTSGPWLGNEKFPDMPGLAAGMKARGARAGIWMRPLSTMERAAESWRLAAHGARPGTVPIAIDPTIPEATAYVTDAVRRLADWGFELIKHDFSTYDLLGRWGFDMGQEITASGWHFHDRSRTTAEIVLDLYRAIRRAAGDTLLLGCNTVGHLSTGFFEVQRIGDDVSGREWSRTRKMGVNTLAFRLAQDRTFFAADADCVPFTRDIPWTLTRKWLDLVARSGTPLFVSVDPATLGSEHRTALKAALKTAATVQPPAAALDWMETTTPEQWKLGGATVRYDWYELD